MKLAVNIPGVLGVAIAGVLAIIAWVVGGLTWAVAAFILAVGVYASVIDRYPGGFKFVHAMQTMVEGEEEPPGLITTFLMPLILMPSLILIGTLGFCARPSEEIDDPKSVALAASGAWATAGLVALLTRRVRNTPKLESDAAPEHVGLRSARRTRKPGLPRAPRYQRKPVVPLFAILGAVGCALVAGGLWACGLRLTSEEGQPYDLPSQLMIGACLGAIGGMICGASWEVLQADSVPRTRKDSR